MNLTDDMLWLVAASPVLAGVYGYLLYPGVLATWAAVRPRRTRAEDPREWPMITILVPAYNEERQIGRTLEALLALDYPADRRQVIVMSDASTDRTDEIVRGFADRGVELFRQPERLGKTAAENAVTARCRGDILVNTDASIRIPPGSLKPLLRVFADPTVGCASGRDISVGDVEREQNAGESGYVGYEMWVRGLETRVGTIIGASGCFYAIRKEVVDAAFPEHLSRDFASPLLARRKGFRTVSVDEATCLVPRTRGLRTEYRRKVRTMARGLETLWFMRDLLDPLRHGRFAWMLWSHKLARWLPFLLACPALLALGVLAVDTPLARGLVAALGAGVALGLVGIAWPPARRAPRPIAMAGFVVAAVAAGAHAWLKALRGERSAMWEPTRRPV